MAKRDGQQYNTAYFTQDDAVQKALGSIDSFLRSNLAKSGKDKTGEKTVDAINELTTQNKQQHDKDVVASIASEKRNRAVNNALFGKVNKGINILDTLSSTLKGAIKSMIGVLTDGFKSSLSKYDSFSAEMRKARLSTEDKKSIQLKSDEAFLKLEEKGIHIDKSDLSDFYASVYNQPGFQNLSTAQVALAGQLHSLGVENKSILTLIRSGSEKDVEAMERIALRLTDRTDDGATVALLTRFQNTVEGINIANKLYNGNQIKMLESMQAEARAARAVTSGYLTGKTIEQLISTKALISSGQISEGVLGEGAITDLMTAMSRSSMDNGASLSQFLEDETKRLQGLSSRERELELQRIQNQLTVLSQSGASADVVNELSSMYAALARGDLKVQQVESDESLKERVRQNTPMGQIEQWAQKLVSAINTGTGGLFSSFSVFMDEQTGGRLTMTDVVMSGFDLTTKLLKDILLAQVSNNLNFTSLFKGKGGLANLFKLGSGATATAGTAAAGAGAGIGLGAIAAGAGILAAIAGLAVTGTLIYKWCRRREDEAEEAKETERKRLKREDELKSLQKQLAITTDPRKRDELMNQIHLTEQEIASALVKEKKQKKIASFRDEGAKEYITEGETMIKDMLSISNSLKQATEEFQKNFGDVSKEIFSITDPVELEKLSDHEKQALQASQEIAKLQSSLLKNATIIQELQVDATTSGHNRSRKELEEAYESGKLNKSAWVSSDVQKDFKDLGFDPQALAEANSQLFAIKSGIEKLEKKGEDAYQATLAQEQMTDDSGQALVKAYEARQNVRTNTSLLNSVLTESLLNTLPKKANGGIVNQATPAIVGEAGKEAILPLERPGALSNVIRDLSISDKVQLLRALLGKEDSKSTVMNILYSILGISSKPSTTNLPSVGNLPNSDKSYIDKIMSYASPSNYDLIYNKVISDIYGVKGKGKYGLGRIKWYSESLANASNQEGRDSIRGTYAEKALEWGVTQLGKPYLLRSLGNLGYVCNELTDAAMRASGFDMKDFNIYSVKTTFSNLVNNRRGTIKRGARAGQEKEWPDFRLRPDLTPETAPPGMVFFQSKKGNEAAPGHIGLVYYGHQRLHSSGGSTSYSKEGFLQGWQTPNRGVTINPFDPSASYQFGEFPGFFAKVGQDQDTYADEFSVSSSSTLEEQRRLAKEAIDSVLSTIDGENRQAAIQYAKEAYTLLNGNNPKEVLESLSIVIKYLRDIATSAKPRVSPATKPLASVY